MITRQLTRVDQGIANRHLSSGTVASVRELSGESVRLLQVLHQEVVTISKYIAASTSGFNAAGNGNYNMSQDISVYLPENPVIYSNIAGRVSDIDVCFSVLSSLQAFHSRVRFVTGLSQQYVARLFKSLDHDLTELDYVTDAWRSMCRTAIAVIGEMDAVIRAQLRVETPFDAERVISMLRVAAEGGEPCVEDGRMVMPVWAERRGHERIPVDLSATLIASASRTSVRLNNVSRGGIGLDNVPEIPIGTVVIVELQHGRVLSGTLQWFDEGRCGIMFCNPLAPCDPLLGNSSN